MHQTPPRRLALPPCALYLQLRALRLPSQLTTSMTLSTKPEVYNVLQRHQKKTEPWLEATCIENDFTQSRRVVSEICSQTDRLTDKLIANLPFLIDFDRRHRYNCGTTALLL